MELPEGEGGERLWLRCKMSRRIQNFENHVFKGVWILLMWELEMVYTVDKK